MKLSIKLATTIILLLFIIPVAKAVSVGLSPAEKEIIVIKEAPTVTYFSISQAEAYNETVTVSTDADWLVLEPATFVLPPYGEQIIKAEIKPLPEGTYTTEIKVTASAPGVVAIKAFFRGRLTVKAVTEVTPEMEEQLKKQAEEVIKLAQDAIREARKLGANVVEAETLLTRAMDELARKNYVSAIESANAAYRLAKRLYEEALEKAKQPLMPLQLGLLIVIFGAIVVVAVLVFEMYRIMKKKREVKMLPVEKGIKCPSCGKDMAVAYKGTMVIGYVCPNSKHTEIKEKTTVEK